MIPRAEITAWRNIAPWKTDEQAEQDLVISRSIVEIFRDEFLAGTLAFRGGTVLHKLYLPPQARYSEDIDLVQIHPEPIGETIRILQKRMDFLGKSSVVQKHANNTLLFRFDSEIAPVQTLRLKVEINCREHFAVMDWIKKDFKIESSWFSGSCALTTYTLEELLGTKMRALYQRRKGRDMYDLYKALTTKKVNTDLVVKCYKKYIGFVSEKPPTKKQFLLNLEEKINNPKFAGDITALLMPNEVYNQNKGYELVKTELIEKL